jgi:replicative DNA helicase
MSERKSPPANLAAEQQLIGIVLKNNDVYRRVANTVDVDAFSTEAHRRIWNVVSQMIEDGRAATPITCRSQFNGSGISGEPAEEYLRKLVETSMPSTLAIDYAREVKDTALKREMISIAEQIAGKCYEGGLEDSPEKIISFFETQMGGIRPLVKRDEDYSSFDDVLNAAAQYANDMWKSGDVLSGLSTGIPKLDSVIGGLQKSDLVILAARPGMGKTALATNIAFSIGRDLKAKRDAGETTGVVAFHSLEMTGEQLGARVLSQQSEVPFWKLRRKLAEPEEVQRFIEAKREIPNLPVRIDAQPGLQLAALRMRLRALKKKHGLAIVIIDYLQLLVPGMDVRSSKDFNRTQEVTAITAALKNLAKELDVPIIALSQLSRQVEARDDKRPKLADLRESGSIEQDADVVMFIYREEYYLKGQKPKEGTQRYLDWEVAMWEAKGVAEILVEKNRHGPTGVAELGFIDQVTTFQNDPPDRGPMPLGSSENDLQGDHQVERKKPLSIPKDALTALVALRDMELIEGTANAGQAPRDVLKVIDYKAWRSKVAIGLLDATKVEDEKAQAKMMEKLLPALTSNELVGRGFDKESGQSWVWILPKGRKRK